MLTQVGLTVSVVLQASMWSSIPLVVPRATLGTALGVAGAAHMAGAGVSHLIIGYILGTSNR